MRGLRGVTSTLRTETTHTLRCRRGGGMYHEEERIGNPQTPLLMPPLVLLSGCRPSSSRRSRHRENEVVLVSCSDRQERSPR